MSGAVVAGGRLRNTPVLVGYNDVAEDPVTGYYLVVGMGAATTAATLTTARMYINGNYGNFYCAWFTGTLVDPDVPADFLVRDASSLFEITALESGVVERSVSLSCEPGDLIGLFTQAVSENPSDQPEIAAGPVEQFDSYYSLSYEGPPYAGGHLALEGRIHNPPWVSASRP